MKTKMLLLIGSVGISLFSPERSSAQLVPLTICAEVQPSAVNQSAKRRATQTECSAKNARRIAIARSRDSASKALTPACRNKITRSEAEAACALHGLTLVTTQQHGGLGDALAVPGTSVPDATQAIESTTDAKLCAVLRDLPDEFESTSQFDLICIFDGFRRTVFVGRSRARCGVQCL